MKKLLLFLSTLVLVACVNNQLLNPSANVPVLEETTVVFALDPDLYPEKKKVGDLKMAFPREEWPQIEQKMRQFALEHQGNLICIDQFKQEGQYLEGRLYQVESQKLIAAQESETKQLILFRDELGSPISKNRSLELDFYGVNLDLKDQMVSDYQVANALDSIPFRFNDEKVLLPLPEAENFFWLSHQVKADQWGQRIQLQYSGLRIVPLDADQGRAWVCSLQSQRKGA